MKISEVKQEYQLQEWSGVLRQRKESGLSVKEWCREQGLAEHIYYYRLRKLRQAACTALEQAQPALTPLRQGLYRLVLAGIHTEQWAYPYPRLSGTAT